MPLATATMTDPILDWPERQRWTRTTTVPEDPHYYVVLRDLPRGEASEAFVAFCRYVREHGERRSWRWSEDHRPVTYSYLRIGPWEYWQAPWGLMNRKWKGDGPDPCAPGSPRRK